MFFMKTFYLLLRYKTKNLKTSIFMAQKINPISLRLKKTNRNFDFSWFNDSNYVNLLMRDLKIQWYINLILKKIKYSSARFLIQNLPTKVKINVFFCNPNKSRKHVSKIFYLSNQKKVRKSKKQFFNTQYNGIPIKQNKIFDYLAKNFTDNFSNLKLKSVCLNRQTTDKTLFNYESDTLAFLKNYLKLIYFIKKHNQFYIRYFLIKYFSNKFPIIDFKNFFLRSEKTIFGLQSKHKLNKLPITSIVCPSGQTNKSQIHLKHDILFIHIMNFLFFYIYKNKTFLALNNFSLKKNNFKKTIASQVKLKLSSLIAHNFTDSTTNLLEKNNKSLSNVNAGNFNEKNLNLNSSTNLYVKSVCPDRQTMTITKIKILSDLNKFNLKCKQFSNFYFNNLNFSELNLEKNLFFTKNLNYKLFSQQVSSKANRLNLEYYNISLINNQCFNDTYNSYCKLSESYKYYNFIYSMSLNQSKLENKLKSVRLDKQTKQIKPIFYDKLLINTNIDKTNFKDNLNSGVSLVKSKKKLTLINSPYKHHMESIISNHFSFNINFNFFQTLNIFQNALFFIDEIVYYIEKRVPFFKIKNYILKKLTEEKHLNIKGIRVMCSGRIGGKSKKAQRSKIQNFKYGETSLHVFSSKIDFKSKNAYTSFGTLGVKVWVCYH